MANLLFLAHRLPYPPNKGDKVRSYHLLRHLTRRHQVHLGTFVDDPDDLRHLQTVREMCAGFHAETINPHLARLRSLSGLMSGEALTLPFYRNPGLAAWVEQTCRSHAIDGTVVFSSAMAQYAEAMPGSSILVDFVDVDSAKWGQYADRHGWPMSWLYRREGRTLLEYERSVASRVTKSYFVTESEADLFRRMAPESAERIGVMCNGVDAGYFTPELEFGSPFSATEVPIVFTGAMDYWPNVDAVCWFAAEVLPALRSRCPSVRFHIVGRSPSPAVQALAGDAVAVSGTVPDVRPYLQHAAVVVAPLRVARGIQNKILEAMAMGRPVVASSSCAGAIDARPGADFLVASDAQAFAEAVLRILNDSRSAAAVGRAGRTLVLERYSWEAHLSQVDTLLEGMVHSPRAAALAPA